MRGSRGLTNGRLLAAAFEAIKPGEVIRIGFPPPSGIIIRMYRRRLFPALPAQEIRATVIESHGDMNAHNTFDDARLVHRFPAASVTKLEISLA